MVSSKAGSEQEEEKQLRVKIRRSSVTKFAMEMLLGQVRRKRPIRVGQEIGQKSLDRFETYGKLLFLGPNSY